MKKSMLKKIMSFTFLMVFSLLLLSAWSTGPARTNDPTTIEKKQSINPVLGDVSFTSKFGYMPDQMTDENLRISTHFEYVENLLCQRDVSGLSPELRANRDYLISLLQDYRKAGKFPRNYDYFGERKPCFIDKDNTICAVGYLVEQTSGRCAAETINARFQYDEVLAMQDHILDSWIAQSGLSKEEVAMIQPTYGGYGPPPCSGDKIYTCRWSDCVYECKCISPNNVAHWQASGHPCEPGNNGNGNGNGNGNYGNGNGPGGNSALFADGFNGLPDAGSFEVFPNPVTTNTTIAFNLENDATISLRIYDVSGKLISTIAEGQMERGSYEVEWSVEDIMPGIYLLRISRGNLVQVEKISVLD